MTALLAGVISFGATFMLWGTIVRSSAFVEDPIKQILLGVFAFILLGVIWLSLYKELFEINVLSCTQSYWVGTGIGIVLGFIPNWLTRNS